MEHFYDKIDSENWFNYAALYRDIVTRCPASAHFVEVGTWKGMSACFMAVEIINSGKNIKFDCVDTWKAHDEIVLPPGEHGDIYGTFIKNIAPVCSYITPVVGLSWQAAEQYQDNSLDFVFIDAGHDYVSVCKDLKAWLPKMKSTGIIAGHDYMDYHPGVVAAVNEIFWKYTDNIVKRETCWLLDLSACDGIKDVEVSSVSSWDCFDTLVFRRLKTPESVFQIMEAKLNLPGFTHQRKEAEKRGPDTIADAYRELALFYGWSDNERQNALDLEVATEVEECFPVVENISKLKQGDIVVSDMYLTEEHIRKILYKCGVTHNIPIYVSSGGKHNGWIWNKLPALAQHTGDNHHSDVVSAERNGVKANHYTDTLDFTANEKLVGGDLALLMRMLRLSNPYVREDIRYMLWNEQTQLNIPALVLIALELPKSNLAFVHRDCIHLQPMHEALYGFKNNEFHCSRLALNPTNTEYMTYVRDTAYGRTIVDLQGSGKSLNNYWITCFGEYPELLYVSGPISKECRVLDTVSDILEKFNNSKLGTLSDWPLRKANEFNSDYLDAQHDAVVLACRLVPKFNIEKNITALHTLVKLMESAETPKIMPHIANH